MDTDNEIRLRLRFYKDVPQNIDALRAKFAKWYIPLCPIFIKTKKQDMS